jgi:hypothetical protein
MSIDSGRIAMSPQNVVVEYLQSKPFLLFFRKDSPPPVIAPFNTTITKDMIKNRPQVSDGKVVSWTDHGRIAVVRQTDGKEAAFWCHELNEARN